MTRILVGVDTSPESIDALRAAAEEARSRDDATLEVAYVFPPPEQVSAWPVLPEKGSDKAPKVEELSAEADSKLAAWLDEVDVDLSGINVERNVIASRKAASALIDRSKEADLAVVGSRGRGGFAGLRLGSVSEQVTRHARCPVLVIRKSTSD
jgi:nucleotide-binding universal stress UspA family protein